MIDHHNSCADDPWVCWWQNLQETRLFEPPILGKSRRFSQPFRGAKRWLPWHECHFFLVDGWLTAGNSGLNSQGWPILSWQTVGEANDQKLVCIVFHDDQYYHEIHTGHHCKGQTEDVGATNCAMICHREPCRAPTQQGMVISLKTHGRNEGVMMTSETPDSYLHNQTWWWFTTETSWFTNLSTIFNPCQPVQNIIYTLSSTITNGRSMLTTPLWWSLLSWYWRLKLHGAGSTMTWFYPWSPSRDRWPV